MQDKMVCLCPCLGSLYTCTVGADNTADWLDVAFWHFSYIMQQMLTKQSGTDDT